jgi:uncharacterized membrane protein
VSSFDAPFEAPRDFSPSDDAPVGELDIASALSEGWHATRRNFIPWLGALGLGAFAAALSVVTVLGLFVIVPVLLWGGVLFTLRAVKGEAHVGDVFEGFSRYPSALGAMLGWILLTALIALPGHVVVQMAAFTGSDNGLALLSIGYVIQLGWTFGVVMRFYFAPYFIVEQGVGPVEALRASWRATAEQKLTVALFGLVSGLIVLSGFLVFGVGVIPAMMIVYGAWAAAYRQISCSRGEHEVTPATRAA